MSDLIDRQEAIDAINALHDKPNAWLDCAVDAVMALPSAQPERTCETCRYNNRTWDMEPFESCTIGGKDSHYEPSAHPEIIRCHQCGFWDRDTLQHNFNDFRDWNEAECLVLAERDGYHEINRYTEADDFCSYAERREE